jgi:hypothetical protein
MMEAARIRVELGLRESDDSQWITLAEVEQARSLKVDTAALEGDFLRVRVKAVREDGAVLIELPGLGARTAVVRRDSLVAADALPGCVYVFGLVALVVVAAAIAGWLLT